MIKLFLLLLTMLISMSSIHGMALTPRVVIADTELSKKSINVTVESAFICQIYDLDQLLINDVGKSSSSKKHSGYKETMITTIKFMDTQPKLCRIQKLKSLIFAKDKSGKAKTRHLY